MERGTASPNRSRSWANRIQPRRRRRRAPAPGRSRGTRRARRSSSGAGDEGPRPPRRDSDLAGLEPGLSAGPASSTGCGLRDRGRLPYRLGDTAPEARPASGSRPGRSGSGRSRRSPEAPRRPAPAGRRTDRPGTLRCRHRAPPVRRGMCAGARRAAEYGVGAGEVARSAARSCQRCPTSPDRASGPVERGQDPAASRRHRKRSSRRSGTRRGRLRLKGLARPPPQKARRARFDRTASTGRAGQARPRRHRRGRDDEDRGPAVGLRAPRQPAQNRRRDPAGIEAQAREAGRGVARHRRRDLPVRDRRGRGRPATPARPSAASDADRIRASVGDRSRDARRRARPSGRQGGQPLPGREGHSPARGGTAAAVGVTVVFQSPRPRTPTRSRRSAVPLCPRNARHRSPVVNSLAPRRSGLSAQPSRRLRYVNLNALSAGGIWRRISYVCTAQSAIHRPMKRGDDV